MFVLLKFNTKMMSENLDGLVSKMLGRPYLIIMGAGKLSKWLGCSREDIYTARTIVREIQRKEDESEEIINLPKILLIDIETSPISSYTWGLWKQDVHLDQIISNWFMLTWSAKWLYSADVMSDRISALEVLEEDDSRIVKSLLMLLDKADVVIAHNGNAFDVVKINARAIRWGLRPPSPYQQIDTLLIARKQFGFSSNKLEALARMFGIPGKTDTNFKLWAECMKGNQEALINMEEYNKNDVIVLEEVYLKLRPWVKGHINLGLYGDGSKIICPNCGSSHLHEDVNYYYTPAGRYKTYRCQCGAISRSRATDIKADERKNIVISVAR